MRKLLVFAALALVACGTRNPTTPQSGSGVPTTSEIEQPSARSSAAAELPRATPVFQPFTLVDSELPGQKTREAKIVLGDGTELMFSADRERDSEQLGHAARAITVGVGANVQELTTYTPHFETGTKAYVWLASEYELALSLMNRTHGDTRGERRATLFRWNARAKRLDVAKQWVGDDLVDGPAWSRPPAGHLPTATP